jgi:hypothetical protein
VDTSWYQQAEAIIHDPYELKPTGTLEIHRSIIDAQTIIAKIMGKQAVKRDKRQIFIGYCVALGWVFDLQHPHFRVTPKKDAIEKMIDYLLIKIPFDLGPLDGKAYAIDLDTKEPLDPSVNSTTIEKLTGLLSWYAPAIPVAATFTYSLFRLGHKHRYKVLLTPTAARYLAFWRAIVILLVMYPHLLGASISSLKALRRTLYYLQTDASSTIKGGGTLTDSPE